MCCNKGRIQNFYGEGAAKDISSGGGYKKLKKSIENLFMFILLNFLQVRQIFRGGGGVKSSTLHWMRS